MIPLISHKEVHQWFSSVLSSGLSPMLLGGVGKGKSHLAQDYAKKRELLLHTIYLDSMYEMDIIGYASPNKETGKFEYLPCDLFPLAGEPLPMNPDTGKPYKGHCILFEEFGNCPKSMQVAAQRVILEKSIGSHKLHEKTNIILLGNKVNSGANALPISAAIRTRCGIAELNTSSAESAMDFLKYAQDSSFHPSVIQWLANNHDWLRQEFRDLIEDGASPFITNRGIEALSNMMHKCQEKADKHKVPMVSLLRGKLATIQSIIGYDAGADFFNATLVPTVGLDEILASPTTAQVATSTADTLRIASFLANNVVTPEQVQATYVYLMRLDPTLRASVASKLIMHAKSVFVGTQVESLLTFPTP
ncbi:MAG: hypothetical protein ACRCVV_22125 [Shewanella sp.]